MGIYFGAKEINSIWFGAKEVETIWMGTDQIYSKADNPKVELLSTVSKPTFDYIVNPSGLSTAGIKTYGPIVMNKVAYYAVVETYKQTVSQSYVYSSYGYAKAFNLETGALISTSNIITFSTYRRETPCFFEYNNVLYFATVVDSYYSSGSSQYSSSISVVVLSFSISGSTITASTVTSVTCRDTFTHNIGISYYGLINSGKIVSASGMLMGPGANTYYGYCVSIDVTTGNTVYGPISKNYTIPFYSSQSKDIMRPFSAMPEDSSFIGCKTNFVETEAKKVWSVSSSGYTQLTETLPSYTYTKVINNSNYYRIVKDTSSVDADTWNASQVGGVDGTFHLRYTLNTSGEDYGWHFDDDDVEEIEEFTPTDPSEVLSDYGITYSGIPTIGETLTVVRTSSSVSITHTHNRILIYKSDFDTSSHTFGTESSAAIPLQQYTSNKPTDVTLIAHGNYITVAHKEGTTWYINLYSITWSTMVTKLMKKYVTVGDGSGQFITNTLFDNGSYNLLNYKNLS